MSRASKSIQSEVGNIAVPEEELKSTLFNAGLEWLKMGARVCLFLLNDLIFEYVLPQ